MSRRIERRDRNHLHRRHVTACRRQLKRRAEQEFRRTVRTYLGA